MSEINLSQSLFFFGGLGFSEKKQDFFRPEIYDFLKQYFPNKLGMFKRIINKLNFKFKGEFIVDLTLPNYIGGYFSPTANILALNPLLILHGTEKEIAHVIFHEGLHAGIFTESPVMDEALVELMTKQKMKEIYGGVEFKSGYDNLVVQTKELFGPMSFNEMSELIESGDKETFNSLLETLVVDSSIEDGIVNLSWEEIKRKLGKYWQVLQKLFPRIMNNIAGNGRGLHEGTNLSLYHFELDGLLANTAKKILSENQDLIVELLMEITNSGKTLLSFQEIKDALFKRGFGYLYDFDSQSLERMFFNFNNAVFDFLSKGKVIKAEEIKLVN